MVVVSCILLILFLVLLVIGSPIAGEHTGSPLRREDTRVRVGRRRGAEAAVDLRVRRMWFADDDGDDDSDTDTDGGIDLSSLDPATRAYVQKLKQNLADVKHESIGRRKYIDRIEPELETLRKSQMKQLEEQGKYKELYEQTQRELAEAKMKAQRADTYEEQTKASNQAKLEQIPDDWKPTVEALAADLPPDKLAMFLDQNMSRFSVPKAPNIDAGTSTGGGKPITLTAEQEEARKISGLTVEQYKELMKEAGII